MEWFCWRVLQFFYTEGQDLFFFSFKVCILVFPDVFFFFHLLSWKLRNQNARDWFEWASEFPPWTFLRMQKDILLFEFRATQKLCWQKCKLSFHTTRPILATSASFMPCLQIFLHFRHPRSKTTRWGHSKPKDILLVTHIKGANFTLLSKAAWLWNVTATRYGKTDFRVSFIACSETCVGQLGPPNFPPFSIFDCKRGINSTFITWKTDGRNI